MLGQACVEGSLEGPQTGSRTVGWPMAAPPPGMCSFCISVVEILLRGFTLLQHQCSVNESTFTTETNAVSLVTSV